MKLNFKELWVQSILAGVCIGLGGAFYLGFESKILGALFFTLGLFTIVTRGFHLFTGRVGYLPGQGPDYAASLGITWLGNLVGTNLVAALLGFTRLAPAVQEKAAALCAVKLNDSLLSLFVLSIFCNILMYIAVDGFRSNPHEVGKYLGLFLCVAGFILAGFEHCVANMFYFGMAGAWSLPALSKLLVMTAGNAVGGLALPLCRWLLSAEKA